jgi:hypothetical protein
VSAPRKPSGSNTQVDVDSPKTSTSALDVARTSSHTSDRSDDSSASFCMSASGLAGCILGCLRCVCVTRASLYCMPASQNAASDRRRWSVIDRTGRDLPGNFAGMRRQTMLALVCWCSGTITKSAAGYTCTFANDLQLCVFCFALTGSWYINSIFILYLGDLQGQDGDSSPTPVHRKRSAVRLPSAGNPSDLLSRTTVRGSLKGSHSQTAVTPLNVPSPSISKSNTSQASLSSGSSNQSAKSAQRTERYFDYACASPSSVDRTFVLVHWRLDSFWQASVRCRRGASAM